MRTPADPAYSAWDAFLWDVIPVGLRDSHPIVWVIWCIAIGVVLRDWWNGD